MFPQIKYEARTIQFEAGDILIGYTDGLPEAGTANGIQFSKDEIARIAAQNADETAQTIYERMPASVIRFHGVD